MTDVASDRRVKDNPAIDQRVVDLLHLFRALGARGRPSGRFAELLRTGSLGPRHMPLLLTLALEGESTVGEVATRIGLLPATTSLLANELNRAGLLERREDDEDRRRTILKVPEAYRGVIEEHARLRMAPLQRALDRLGPRGTERLLSALRVLAEELEAASTASQTEDCG
jgi:DNA-binding MarR family transcriptional regulator